MKFNTRKRPCLTFGCSNGCVAGLVHGAAGYRGPWRDLGHGLGGRETITVHIPLMFRMRGGRELMVTPDGAEWAPRPRVDNAMVKALARAFR